MELLDPGISKCFSGRGTVLGQLLKHFLDKIFGRLTYTRPFLTYFMNLIKYLVQRFKMLCLNEIYLTIKGVVAFKNFIINGVGISSIERRITTEQNVENDTTTPHIAFLVVLTLNNFRSDIVWL